MVARTERELRSAQAKFDRFTPQQWQDPTQRTWGGLGTICIIVWVGSKKRRDFRDLRAFARRDWLLHRDSEPVKGKTHRETVYKAAFAGRLIQHKRGFGLVLGERYYALPSDADIYVIKPGAAVTPHQIAAVASAADIG